MIWSIREEIVDVNSSRNALGKARNDICDILAEEGLEETIINHPDVDRRSAGFIRKSLAHVTEAGKWKNKEKLFKSGDIVVLQYPPVNHTLLFSSIVKKWKRKGIKTVAFIHDLELIRNAVYQEFSLAKRIRIWLEEISVIKEFDCIIVHNQQMKEYLCSRHHIPEHKLISLDIFDYLSEDQNGSFAEKPNTESGGGDHIVIAGNFSYEKAKYVYQLPEQPDFDLYGVNFHEYQQQNVHYKGAFEAEEIAEKLSGKYGLIWDGESPASCTGVYGNYLRYNNPHKTSLYLATGLPVIIWEEAAMARFILDNGCGIAVKSLHDIDAVVKSITEEQYLKMKENAAAIGHNLRRGYYTKRALNTALELKR